MNSTLDIIRIVIIRMMSNVLYTYKKVNTWQKNSYKIFGYEEREGLVPAMLIPGVG